MTRRARTVLVASLSAIRGDSRILRQIDAVLAAGHSVVAVGAGGGREHPAEESGRLRFVDFSAAGWTRQRQAVAAASFFIGGVTGFRALVATYPGIAALTDTVGRLAAINGPPEFAIANDWQALPAILALNRRYGTPFHYDTHEHALSEHSHNPMWRIAFPRLIRRIERAGVRAAHSVSSPSSGICRDLAAQYGPIERIATIRNMMDKAPLPPRAIGMPIRVLYHGLFKEDRGLVSLVRSVAKWPERFVLNLRGKTVSPAFEAVLQAEVAAAAGRVVLYPMAPAEELTQLTNTADIGVFLPDVSSPQLRHALPNKVFEYLNGGLMLLVPKDCDMADLVGDTGAGLAIDPQELAATLANLTDQDIARYKAAAHKAALDLTWKAEAQKFCAIAGL